MPSPIVAYPAEHRRGTLRDRAPDPGSGRAALFVPGLGPGAAAAAHAAGRPTASARAGSASAGAGSTSAAAPAGGHAADGRPRRRAALPRSAARSQHHHRLAHPGAGHRGAGHGLRHHQRATSAPAATPPWPTCSRTCPAWRRSSSITPSRGRWSRCAGVVGNNKIVLLVNGMRVNPARRRGADDPQRHQRPLRRARSRSSTAPARPCTARTPSARSSTSRPAAPATSPSRCWAATASTTPRRATPRFARPSSSSPTCPSR